MDAPTPPWGVKGARDMTGVVSRCDTRTSVSMRGRGLGGGGGHQFEIDDGRIDLR